jgi:hypothetical protein
MDIHPYISEPPDKALYPTTQKPNNTTMQNQITNQLLLFGIQPGEYQITTHLAGEIEITAGGNTITVIPMIGRKAIQLNRKWTLDRIPSESVILAVSAVVAALLRCRHTAAPRPQIGTLPALPAPRLWCAACGKWGDHGSGSCPTISHAATLPAPRPQHGAAGTPWQRLGALQVSPLLEAMVDKTPSLRGGETATIPRLGIYPTDNHSPEDYE